MSHAPSAPTRRPREVTLAGLQAVVGGAVSVLFVLQAAQEIDSEEMRSALADLVRSDQAATLGLTLESARTLLRYTIMALGVVSVMSLILGIYVLRRHRGSRVALTILGGLVGGLCLLAGPLGWIVTAYVGVALALLWTRPARAWFADPEQPGTGQPTSGPPLPPYPPVPPGPGDGRPWPPPPPPPPPPSRPSKR